MAVNFPITREDLTLAILESLSVPASAPNGHTYLDQIYHIAPHVDPLVQEMRLVRFAIGLIDYGARIAASSPLFNEFGKLLGPLMTALSDLDLLEAQRSTKQLQESIDLLESSITGDTSQVEKIPLFHAPEFQRMVSSARDRLKAQTLHDD